MAKREERRLGETVAGATKRRATEWGRDRERNNKKEMDGKTPRETKGELGTYRNVKKEMDWGRCRRRVREWKTEDGR